MALYVIGDLHLSFAVNKPMDIFGGAWDGYVDKIRAGLSVLTPADTLILCGDTSWGISLAEALEDFRFLDSFPGEKWLVKGNHDYWWTTKAKTMRFFQDNHIHSLNILHNTAILREEKILCATRGWFDVEEGQEPQDEKVLKRECGRLVMSLEEGKKLGQGDIICFLHYPPLYEGYRCDPIWHVLQEYHVARCYYGHLHGHACRRRLEGEQEGIDLRLISADHVDFKPVLC